LNALARARQNILRGSWLRFRRQGFGLTFLKGTDGLFEGQPLGTQHLRSRALPLSDDRCQNDRTIDLAAPAVTCSGSCCFKNSLEFERERSRHCPGLAALLNTPEIG
jgi:hypothetical protein